MKLIKGEKYVITGYKNEEERKTSRGCGVKFPQTVTYDGSKFFILKDKDGVCLYFTWRFAIKPFDSATVEIYNSRGSFKFRVKSSNGKILNHLFDTKPLCKNGIKALVRAMSNYKIIDLTK